MKLGINICHLYTVMYCEAKRGADLKLSHEMEHYAL